MGTPCRCVQALLQGCARTTAVSPPPQAPEMATDHSQAASSRAAGISGSSSCSSGWSDGSAQRQTTGTPPLQRAGPHVRPSTQPSTPHAHSTTTSVQKATLIPFPMAATAAQPHSWNQCLSSSKIHSKIKIQQELVWTSLACHGAMDEWPT